MKRKKTDEARPEESWSYARGKLGFLADLLGILTAVAIAFGGLALVRLRLSAEEDRLLEEGGEIRVQTQTRHLDSQAMGDVEIGQAELTQEELVQAVEYLEQGGDRYLHEPQADQLSMAQAVDCAKAWVGDFLLPRLGAESDIRGEAREYKVDCFLWTREENSLEGSAEVPWLSYWSVELDGPDIDGMLILNAATGQVMSAAVTVSCPTEYQRRGWIETMLEDYADSFGIVSGYSIAGEYDPGTNSFHQSRGNEEVSAIIDISTVVVATSAEPDSESGDGEDGGVYEYDYIYLYLRKTDVNDASVIISVPN